MSFKDSEITHLQQLGIIDSETAGRIRQHYASQSESGQNRLTAIFGVLGALPVGTGIILMVAHNWDEMGRSLKTFLALLPMLIGQAVCAFTLLKKEESQTWREGSATFLLFAIGAAISLVAQIYHIPGNLSGFLLTWSLLSLPLIYLMRSSMVSLLYLAGICWYTMSDSLGSNSGNPQFWPLLAAAIPHYAGLLKTNPRSNFTNVHHWAMALALFFGLMGMAHPWESATIPVFAAMFTFTAATGLWLHHRFNISRNNGLVILGVLSLVFQLFALSYHGSWKAINFSDNLLVKLTPGSDIWLLPLLLAALVFLAMRINIFSQNFHPLALALPVLLVALAANAASPVAATVLVNLLLLYIGIDSIRKGHHNNNLSLLNWGLGIISVLIVLRFFDLRMSFVLRGIIFILLGTAFFVANYQLLRKRKKQSEQ